MAEVSKLDTLMRSMGEEVSEMEFKDMVKSLPVHGECVRSTNAKSIGLRTFCSFGVFIVVVGGGSSFCYFNIFIYNLL